MLARHAARRVLAIPRRGFAGTSIPQGVPGASTRYVEDQVREISLARPRAQADTHPQRRLGRPAAAARELSAANGAPSALHAAQICTVAGCR